LPPGGSMLLKVPRLKRKASVKLCKRRLQAVLRTVPLAHDNR
jgi:hypothetical protein